LPAIKSASLHELTFDGHQGVLAETAINCPNLRVLVTYWIDIDHVFLHFPRLECLSCRAKIETNVAIHQHLKHLRIDSDSLDDLLSIINRCEILESLTSSANFTQASIETLLVTKPGLKSLFLKSFDPKLLGTIKKFGGNLEVFQFKCSTYKPFSIDMLKTKLQDVFDEFEGQGRYEGDRVYVARKFGAIANFQFD
jgi:hypothetical protein